MNFVKYWFQRLKRPVDGLMYGLRYDSAIQLEIIGGLTVLTFLHFILGPFSNLGQLLLFLSFFLMVALEFVNSALEDMMDVLHPDYHEKIGSAKDMAASAVLAVSLFGLCCLYYAATGKI